MYTGHKSFRIRLRYLVAAQDQQSSPFVTRFRIHTWYIVLWSVVRQLLTDFLYSFVATGVLAGHPVNFSCF